MNKFGFATALTMGLASLGMGAGAGTAAADGLDVSPPAFIDANGFQDYDTSSYPAPPSYPAGSSYPGASSWPG